LHETIRIKSATWDDSGVLLYSTLNHIKYTLLNGDNGIVRTLDQTVYLVKVKGRNVYCLDRAAKPKVLTVDPTEYRFKLSLVKRNYDEMLQIIKNSTLVGQSIISYLQKKGYPEIALQFVQDPQTRFELAIECGNLEVATEMAKELDRPKIWTRLGAEALIHGNHQTVEMTHQKLRNFDKLSFLYLCTGDEEKLSRMAKIAEHRGDFVSRFQNALYLGDVESRIQMFKEIDQYPLAYLTAKSHGLTDECQSILELCGLTEDEISMPESAERIVPPKAIVSTYKVNWPVKEASHSSFERALLGEVGVAVEDEASPDLLTEDAPAAADGDVLAAVEDGDAGEGWDMGDDIGLDATGNDSDFVNVDNPDAPLEAAGPGSSEADMWSRNSPLAADHVAAGSFDSAMQLLNRQVGAVHFQPLKPRFLEIYQASRTYLPANAGLPPIMNYVRRTIDETDSRKFLPVIPRNLETLTNVDLQEGYTTMRTNKLESGVITFKTLLQSLLVNVVSSQAQVDEAKALITKSMEYTLAMSIELERRQLAASGGDSEEQLKRQLELSAYFTMPKLEVAHRQLALMAAMKLAFSNKQYSSALSFANRILANGGAAKLVEQVSS
jgi:coatomer protein complex subunit alpha (xenin)